MRNKVVKAINLSRLSLSDVARLTGVAQGTLWGWINQGRLPQRKLAAKVLRALERSSRSDNLDVRPVTTQTVPVFQTGASLPPRFYWRCGSCGQMYPLRLKTCPLDDESRPQLTVSAELMEAIVADSEEKARTRERSKGHEREAAAQAAEALRTGKVVAMDVYSRRAQKPVELWNTAEYPTRRAVEIGGLIDADLDNGRVDATKAEALVSRIMEATIKAPEFARASLEDALVKAIGLRRRMQESGSPDPKSREQLRAILNQLQRIETGFGTERAKLKVPDTAREAYEASEPRSLGGGMGKAAETPETRLTGAVCTSCGHVQELSESEGDRNTCSECDSPMVAFDIDVVNALTGSGLYQPSAVALTNATEGLGSWEIVNRPEFPLYQALDMASSIAKDFDENRIAEGKVGMLISHIKDATKTMPTSTQHVLADALRAAKALPASAQNRQHPTDRMKSQVDAILRKLDMAKAVFKVLHVHALKERPQ